MKKLNEELNKKAEYKDKKCILCERSYPETVLNIEGVIHHNMKYTCLDIKSCRKVTRKAKRKGKK